MGMIIKVYVEYDNQEVNITTLNSDNSNTSTVTITSKFVEEYLRTVGAEEYKKRSEDETETIGKDRHNVNNAEIDENAFSPMSETDLSQYTVLDSTCDDEEANESFVKVPSYNSTRIKEIENPLNRTREHDSSQDTNVTASTILIDDIVNEPAKLVPTNCEKGSVDNRNEIVDIKETTATDLEKNMNALQIMSCNVDDFLTSVPGEAKPGEMTTTLHINSENPTEKYDDDDIAVADMSRYDIVKDFDPNLKEYFIVDEILASRFNEETQLTEYLLKPRKCIPRDDRWRPLSKLEVPNRLPIIEPDRLYIQCPKVPRNEKFKVKKNNGKVLATNSGGADFIVPDTPKVANTSQDRLKKDNREKLPKSRPIRPRFKTTLPVLNTTSMAETSPPPLSNKIASNSSPSPSPVRELPSNCTKLSETQNTFTNWLQCSVCQTQCFSLSSLIAHKKTHSKKPRIAAKRKLKTELPDATDLVHKRIKRINERTCEESTTPTIINHNSPHFLPVHIPLDKIEVTKTLLMNSAKKERRNGVKLENKNKPNSSQARLKKQRTKLVRDRSEESKSRNSTPAGKGQKKVTSREFIESDDDSDNSKIEKIPDKCSQLTPSSTKQDNHRIDETKSEQFPITSSNSKTPVSSGKRPQTARRTKKFGQQIKNNEDRQDTIEHSSVVQSSREKEVSESGCNQKSSSSSQLPNAETESSMGNENDKYECPYCPFTTHEKHQLHTHEFAHKGGVTHPCDLCNRTFVSTHGLWLHKTQHHREQSSNNDRICNRVQSRKYPIVLVKKLLL